MQLVRKPLGKDTIPWCQNRQTKNHKNVVYLLRKDEVGVYSTDPARLATFVNEPGLYKVILQSRKPAALRLFDWITHDVLPSIRKTGQYSLNRDQQIIQEILSHKEDNIYIKGLLEDKETVPVGTFAKILYGKGIKTGRIRLFRKLRQDGFLMKDPHSEKNKPTQRSIGLNLIKVREQAIHHPSC